jgi:hypothetical protein
MPTLTSIEEQERARTSYYHWYSRLQELETAGLRDYEWRIAKLAEHAWASAMVRTGLQYPTEHLNQRYVA